MADPDIVRLTSVGFVPQQTKALLDTFATESEAGGAVASVNGQTGAVVLDAADVGAVAGTTIAPLTGTVGTANDAMTAVPAAVNAATGADTATLPTTASVNTSITAINNNLADLQAKVNAIIAALAP